MPEMFTAVMDRVRAAQALDDKASTGWEALHTSASTAEVLAAGGRFVCTMRRDAPDDLALVIEGRRLLRVLADDCQALVGQLERLIDARDQLAAEAAEGSRSAAAAHEAERAALQARLAQVEADHAALLAECEARGARSLECFRDNTKARAFYEAHGWRLARSYARDFAGDTHHFVFYEKNGAPPS